MKLRIAVTVLTLAVSGSAFAQSSGQQEPTQEQHGGTGNLPSQGEQTGTGGSGAQEQESQQESQRQSDEAVQQQQAGTGGAGQMDMSKMGPWTRKPKDEAKVRKEAQRFFQEEDKVMKEGDFDAMLARIDFPVFMATDDSKGQPKAMLVDREEYAKMMKPMYEQMPKDLKVSHKPNFTVLSDSLVTYTDDFSMTMGGKKYSGKSSGLIVKRDGQWKWKSFTEPGWGDMEEPGVGGSPMDSEQQQQKDQQQQQQP